MYSYLLNYEVNNKLYTLTDEQDEHISLIIKETKNTLKVILKPNKEVIIKSFSLMIPFKYFPQCQIYCNGYQSWTDSYIYDLHHHFKDASKIIKPLNDQYAFKMYGDSWFKKYQKDVLHSYTYSYILGPNQLFIGSFNEDYNFLIINHHHRLDQIILEPDVKDLHVSSDYPLLDIYVNTSYRQGIEAYFKTFKPRTNISLKGYTSWYNHYQNINKDLLLEALNPLDKEHYDLFQIDDGYQKYVGDWLEINKEKFPNGFEDIKLIVDKTHQKGLKAGIWISPFICEKDSMIYKLHPEWIVKDKYHKDLKIGGNWSGFYALNFNLDEVKAYIKKCLEKYLELGFDFFKLDFLYASSFSQTKYLTKAMVSKEAYTFVRNILKDQLILGCGATLSTCFGLFDYVRIGPDVSTSFDDVWYMRMFHRERISTKNTIRNTIYRHHLNNHVFINDPDVYILRDNNVTLTKKQKEALLTINILFGDILLTSDYLNELNEEALKLYQSLLNLKQEVSLITHVKTTKKQIICEVYLKDNTSKTLIYYPKKGKIQWIEQ